MSVSVSVSVTVSVSVSVTVSVSVRILIQGPIRQTRAIAHRAKSRIMDLTTASRAYQPSVPGWGLKIIGVIVTASHHLVDGF